MLIQCHIKRDGETDVTLERFRYVFMACPSLTEGDTEAKVAQVLSVPHQQYFLANPDFGEYQPRKKGK